MEGQKVPFHVNISAWKAPFTQLEDNATKTAAISYVGPLYLLTLSLVLDPRSFHSQ